MLKSLKQMWQTPQSPKLSPPKSVPQLINITFDQDQAKRLKHICIVKLIKIYQACVKVNHAQTGEVINLYHKVRQIKITEKTGETLSIISTTLQGALSDIKDREAKAALSFPDIDSCLTLSTPSADSSNPAVMQRFYYPPSEVVPVSSQDFLEPIAIPKSADMSFLLSIIKQSLELVEGNSFKFDTDTHGLISSWLKLEGITDTKGELAPSCSPQPGTQEEDTSSATPLSDQYTEVASASSSTHSAPAMQSPASSSVATTYAITATAVTPPKSKGEVSEELSTVVADSTPELLDSCLYQPGEQEESTSSAPSPSSQYIEVASASSSARSAPAIQSPSSSSSTTVYAATISVSPRNNEEGPEDLYDSSASSCHDPWTKLCTLISCERDLISQDSSGSMSKVKLISLLKNYCINQLAYLYIKAKMGLYGNLEVDSKELVAFYGDLENFPIKPTEEAESLLEALIDLLRGVEEVAVIGDSHNEHAYPLWYMPKFSEFLESYIDSNPTVRKEELCDLQEESALCASSATISAQYTPSFEYLKEECNIKMLMIRAEITSYISATQFLMFLEAYRKLMNHDANAAEQSARDISAISSHKDSDLTTNALLAPKLKYDYTQSINNMKMYYKKLETLDHYIKNLKSEDSSALLADCFHKLYDDLNALYLYVLSLQGADEEQEPESQAAPLDFSAPNDPALEFASYFPDVQCASIMGAAP